MSRRLLRPRAAAPTSPGLRHPKEGAPGSSGLPQIPSALLPAGGGSDGATGISVHDGKKWLPPQLLAGASQHCDVRFAWCQQDDLHLLIETSEAERLYHLCYRPSTQSWARLNVLDHGGTAFCAQDGAIHLAYYDYNRRRVCYRLYDGEQWSKAAWFDAKGDFDGLAVAAGGDGTGHVVWKEGRTVVAHACIKNGRAETSRQSLADRPIEYRDFALVAAPDGSLMMAYRADLYEGHPDRNRAHVRTWNGQSWSEAAVIPFDSGDFLTPIFVRHGRAVLLSWVPGSPSVRVFSILGSDGTWSYPLPLCSAQEGKLRCDHFVSLHADPQGRVRAAWYANEETYTAIVTKLDK